jgi:hypothetical protein
VGTDSLITSKNRLNPIIFSSKIALGPKLSPGNQLKSELSWLNLISSLTSKTHKGQSRQKKE